MRGEVSTVGMGCFFFFQAEDGIRDDLVTGVQTCALPISLGWCGLIPNGFRMSPHQPSANSAPYRLLAKMTGETVTTTIDFVLPNLRTEIDRDRKSVV